MIIFNVLSFGCHLFVIWSCSNLLNSRRQSDCINQNYLNESYLLFTGDAGVPAPCRTELNTIPQILSTQPWLMSDCAVGLNVLVAQGILIQSVAQFVPVSVPALAVPDGEFWPFILKAIDMGLDTKISVIVSNK